MGSHSSLGDVTPTKKPGSAKKKKKKKPSTPIPIAALAAARDRFKTPEAKKKHKISSSSNNKHQRHGASSAATAPASSSAPGSVARRNIQHASSRASGSDSRRSTASARRAFEWLIAPVSVEEFDRRHREKAPLLVRAAERDAFFAAARAGARKGGSDGGDSDDGSDSDDSDDSGNTDDDSDDLGDRDLGRDRGGADEKDGALRSAGTAGAGVVRRGSSSSLHSKSSSAAARAVRGVPTLAGVGGTGADYWSGLYSKKDVETLVASSAARAGDGEGKRKSTKKRKRNDGGDGGAGAGAVAGGGASDALQGHVDVTFFDPVAGKRETMPHDSYGEDGRGVWRMFSDRKKGCSVRVLHPQRHCRSVWALCERLEEWFGTQVGTNAYLTPGGSQGFAPHWDDVDVFILQTEGSKHWTIHGAREVAEYLPRFSSRDFEPRELEGIEPIMEVTLEPGDMLFLPRGTIHQARTPDEVPHSLHLTVSACQRTTWFDYLQETLVRGLEAAAEEIPALRSSMPRGYFNYMGVAHADLPDIDDPTGLPSTTGGGGGPESDDDGNEDGDGSDDGESDDGDSDDDADNGDGLGDDGRRRAPFVGQDRGAWMKRLRTGVGAIGLDYDDPVGAEEDAERRTTLRSRFRRRAMHLMACALDHAPLDGGADFLAARFIQGSLPPMLTRREHRRTALRFPDGEERDAAGVVDLADKVRIVRNNAQRIVAEGDKVVVYHLMSNNRDIQLNPEDPVGVEFPVEDAPAIEAIIDAYPGWIDVAALPCETDEIKVDVASALYREGLIMSRRSQNPVARTPVPAAPLSSGRAPASSLPKKSPADKRKAKKEKLKMRKKLLRS